MLYWPVLGEETERSKMNPPNRQKYPSLVCDYLFLGGPSLRLVRRLPSLIQPGRRRTSSSCGERVFTARGLLERRKTGWIRSLAG